MGINDAIGMWGAKAGSPPTPQPLPTSQPVEQVKQRETTELPKNAPHQTASGSVSWSPVNETSSKKVTSLIPPYPWPFWADMPMQECIDFYLQKMEAAAQLGDEVFHKMRAHFAENDLFFVLINLLERKDMIHPWLYARCREFQRNPNGHLDLWAREHGKSSIITLGGTIWEIIRYPEITIGIFSHTKPVAKKFLSQIMYEFESRAEMFHTLWPDTFWANPRKEAPVWSKDEGFVVKRKSNPKEATVEASGLVDGQPTGRHYILRIYDDVVTLESVNTADQIQKTTSGWEMSDNLGTEGGAVRYIGTRYHKFDTYHTMMERGVATPRIYPATHDGTETGTPVLMHADTLAEKRRTQGPYTFASQMLQNPLADTAMGFQEAWLRSAHAEITYEQAMVATNRIIIVDPSGGKQRTKNNDYSSFWVVGKAADGKYYPLEFIRDRLNLTQRAAALMYLHRKWKPRKVGYEEYGMQADIEHIEYVQQQETYRFPIIPLGGRMSKENRILRLVPYFENGMICFPLTMMYKDSSGQQVDLVKVFVEEEYSAFPVLAHDDMLDGLSRFIDPEMEVETPIESTIIKARQFDVEAALRDRAFNGGRVGSSSSGFSDNWMTA